MKDSDRPADDLELPARLAQELQALQGQPVMVPQSVDERLVREARVWLGSHTRARRVVALPGWLAAAAAVLLLIGVASLVMWFPRSSSELQADLNGDGRFDILDALALARRLHEGGTLEPSLDINGDGTVDGKDVETLAMRAVRLGKEQG